MALLDIDKLTIRFGGLTAVNQVDVAVDEGRIVSIIGPNGAGKTTVFNAVTAIYEPTEGAVRYRGHDMRRPFGWKVVAACAAIGLATALGAALISTNLDRLWKTAVKQNYRDPSKPFPVAKAWADAWAYLGGDVKIERRGSRWHVVPYDSSRSLGSSPREEEAAERLRNVREMIALDGSDRTIEEREGKFVVLSADRSRALASFDTRREAADKLADLASVGDEGRTVRIAAWAAFFIGLALGSLGTYSVWAQSRRTPHVVATHGLARTFQNIRLFQEMTVLENVVVGMHRHLDPGADRWVRWAVPSGLAASVLFTAAGQALGWLGTAVTGALLAAAAGGFAPWIAWITHRRALSAGELRAEKEAEARARELLEFVGLKGREWMLARNLPYGDQRRLEIARAMATKPALLLLDEPAAGMNPAETGELMKLIRRIRDVGVTVLLIEHHMNVVMGISDRIAVLNFGTKIAEGTPAEVKANPAVIEAYLGKEEVG